MSKIIDKIKEKGYWRILLRPSVFDKEKVKTLNELRTLVEENQVKLRGWYYPHFDYKDISNGVDYIETSCDWGHHKEFLRLYQSGQLVHYKAIREDYLVDLSRVKPFSINEPSPTNKYFEIFFTLFTITEIFQFAARLVAKGILIPKFDLSISLFDLLDRQLFFFDEGRDLWGNYRCKLDKLEFTKNFESNDFIRNHNDLAINTTFWIFERFNWVSCPIGLLKEEQNKLIQRRL